MSYYSMRPMGDYKTYGYAGDPGFLSSLWKGIKKIARPIIGGLIGGIPGMIVAGQSPRMVPRTQLALPPIPGTIGGAVTFPGGVSVSGQFTGGGQRPMIPGRGPLPPFEPGGVGQMGRGGTLMPSGYHYAKDGSGRLVRNRRMNVANPRALRRSMRRVQGFEKLAKRTIQFTRRVKMKKRRSS